MKRRNKRCSIERLKGVSKRLKGHLLQANWASFQSQKSINDFSSNEFSLQSLNTKQE